MIEIAISTLNKKHLLIIGESQVERRNFINNIVLSFDFEVFRFPSNMKLLDDYVNYVKKEKLFEPWYDSKSYNVNQILDFHRDWISNNNSLIIIEEYVDMEEIWDIELLRIYIDEIENRKKGEQKIHLIISQENENGLIEKLTSIIDFKEGEMRTKQQIIEQNIAIIDLSTINQK